MQHHFTTRCLTYAVFLLCLDVKARGGLRFKRLGGRVDSHAFTQTISERGAAGKKKHKDVLDFIYDSICFAKVMFS